MEKFAEKSDELWDLYDENRILTGKTHRRGDPMKEGEYHLVVHVCIFNSKNELLIQQRQPFKKGWSNMWDITVGGSAVSGDTSREAAEREVLEELGLELDLTGVRPYFTIHFENGFDDYYFIEKDVDITKLKLQEEEVKTVRWATHEEVLKMAEDGIMIPHIMLDKLFEMKERALGNREEDREEIMIQKAGLENLPSILSLFEVIDETLSEHEECEILEANKRAAEDYIRQGMAVCALFGKIVVGILLYSPQKNMPVYVAVHPEFRGRKIASEMMGNIIK